MLIFSSFYSDVFDDLSYIIPFLPLWHPDFLCHYSVACGILFIHPQSWGFQRAYSGLEQLEALAFLPVFVVKYYFTVLVTREFTSFLMPVDSWQPGTLRGLRRHHERPTKSTSRIWLVPSWPCTSLYCGQGHAEGTQVNFYFCFCLF